VILKKGKKRGGKSWEKTFAQCRQRGKSRASHSREVEKPKRVPAGRRRGSGASFELRKRGKGEETERRRQEREAVWSFFFIEGGWKPSIRSSAVERGDEIRNATLGNELKGGCGGYLVLIAFPGLPGPLQFRKARLWSVEKKEHYQKKSHT